MGKNAMLLLGGGMSSVYTAGFLSCLIELNIYPEIILATSGNAGTAFYYATKNGNAKEIGKKIWVDELSSNKFLNKKRKPVIDIDYLVDFLFKKKYPLDISKLKSEEGLEVIVSSNKFETGELKFFSSKQSDDLFEILKATKALPYFYNKKIKINNENYIDLNPFFPIQTYLEFLKQKDIKNLIIINNGVKFEKYFKNLFIKFFVLCFFIFGLKIKVAIRMVRNIIKRQYINFDGQFLLFENKDQASLDNNHDNLDKIYQKGYNNCKENISKIKKLYNL
jgi:predicted patatin/cPLA2 family phospholipase